MISPYKTEDVRRVGPQLSTINLMTNHINLPTPAAGKKTSLRQPHLESTGDS